MAKAQDKRKVISIGTRLTNPRFVEMFGLFKDSMGFENDAEAARVLMCQRLMQLKRQGKLAKAA